MPKDPLFLKVERVRQKPNLYAEDLYAHETEPLDSLLSESEQVYLSCYG